MTEDEIRTMAAYLMDKHLNRHWTFGFRDTLPTSGGRDLAGHTSWDRRQIVLSRRYAFDYPPEGIAWILTHEVAHALTPEDWVHGEIFQAKWRELRG